jgi:hypothetical protein
MLWLSKSITHQLEFKPWLIKASLCLLCKGSSVHKLLIGIKNTCAVHFIQELHLLIIIADQQHYVSLARHTGIFLPMLCLANTSQNLLLYMI